MSFSAASAAMDTCTSPRLAALARAVASPVASLVASLVAGAPRLAPKTPSSQLASRPTCKSLSVLSPPRVPRCAEAKLPSVGWSASSPSM